MAGKKHKGKENLSLVISLFTVEKNPSLGSLAPVFSISFLALDSTC